MDAQSWQSQLQGEMNRIQQRSGLMKTEGQVTVQEQGAEMVATLPTMVITGADNTQWKVPSIALVAPASAGATGKVTIRLPSAISYKDAAGQERSKIAIGQQNISGTWDFAKNAFQNLNGSLQSVSFTDKPTNTQSSVANIRIAAANASQATITATDMDSSSTIEGKASATSIGKVGVSYQFADAMPLTITRVVGLLNPVWLLAENQNFTISTDSSQLSFTDHTGRVSTIAGVTSRTLVKPQNGGKILGADQQLTLTGATQTPESAYGFVLPKKLHMNGVITNMPVQMLSFGPGQAFDIAKKAAAQSGMRIDVSQITWDTYNQANLKGKGWLKAADGVPLGMTGQLTFDLENLQALITSLQKQLSTPGGDMKVKAQGLVLMMVLQGMGKQNSNVTQFVLDLTADGQVLVNGNNIAALIPNANPGAGLGSALQGFMNKNGGQKSANSGI